MNAVVVIKPGLLTSVQDLGRDEHTTLGVSRCGALDCAALRIANLLVGNPPHAAGLEFTLHGPTLRFTMDNWIAVTGGRFETRINGVACPMWRSLAVSAGDVVEIGGALLGARGYLALRGGLAIAPALGSRSTDLLARFGGWHGRSLRRDDELPLGDAAGVWRELAVRPPLWRKHVRLLPGPEFDRLSAASRDTLIDHAWRVSADSNRMGCRLSGEKILALNRAGELPSHAVFPGTVQLPADGAPIVLLADAQTTGGYPRIASVIQADLWLVAQTPPGGALRFVVVDRVEAVAALGLRNRWLNRIAQGVELRR